jgi:hypothetical protein
MMQLQQGFAIRVMGFRVSVHGSNPELLMSALECAEQTISTACVKAPHIASLTTKAFFGKCQMSFRSVGPLNISLYRPSKSRSILIRPVAIPVANFY